MRILVPLDGSQLAEYALGAAAQIARESSDSRIDLLTVITISTMAGTYDYPQVISYQVDSGIDTSSAYLHDIKHRQTLSQMNVEAHVEVGVPSDIICATAHELKSDFILMTSHGRTGLARIAMGSVAEDVARKSHIPTMILKVSELTFAKNVSAEPFSLLIPLDGASLAETVLQPAATIAKVFHGAVTLLQVIATTSHDPKKTEDLSHQSEAYLFSMQQRLQKEGFNVRVKTLWGDPVAQIQHYATDPAHGIDLIAMATHGRTGPEKLAFGSVAESVLHRVALPVLLINPVNPD